MQADMAKVTGHSANLQFQMSQEQHGSPTNKLCSKIQTQYHTNFRHKKCANTEYSLKCCFDAVPKQHSLFFGPTSACHSLIQQYSPNWLGFLYSSVFTFTGAHPFHTQNFFSG
jgi:hypothetical protein